MSFENSVNQNQKNIQKKLHLESFHMLNRQKCIPVIVFTEILRVLLFSTIIR